ncbi:hypothetical protein FGB62_122g037 [Gracilaria domingensis]|nr:hypothetical protein FGB62_122g037 [Gracilaria domingensis]
MGSTCIASRAPSSMVLPPNRRPRFFPTKTCASADEEDHEEFNPDESKSEMHVYKKRGQKRECSQGDMLPFDVSIGTPPPEHLGRFRLDPRTHCGDIVEHEGRHFVVKSVRMRYKYLQGKYRMIGKAIEVKSLARKSIEAYLEKALRES